MATKITCPGCSTQLEIGDSYTGERVECPSCQSILILKAAPAPPEPAPVVPPPDRMFEGPLDDERRAALDDRARRHLALWLDLPQAEIDEALGRIDAGQAYETWQIPKAGPSFRTIRAPLPVVKKVQRRILDRLLYRIPVSNAAHGFVPGRSIVTGARVHLDDAFEILNVDLKDAFPSVDATRVKHLLVRYVKTPLKHLGPYVEHEVAGQAIARLVDLVTYENQLPQGSPTSGCLLNLACTKLDKYIYRALGRYPGDLRYTRYADDLTISSRGGQEIVEDCRREVQEIIRSCGFRINPAKIRYLSKRRNQKLEVTGLILEKGLVRIEPSTLDRYRATIHQAAMADALDDEKKLEVQSIIAFVRMVYPSLPHKIAGPFQKYAEKHLPAEPRIRRSFGLDFYKGP